jgi:hypothetical protein
MALPTKERQLGERENQSANSVGGQFANRLSLIAFATGTLRGLLIGSEFSAAVKTSLIVLAVFYGVGYILGDLARRVVEESADVELAQWKAEQIASGLQTSPSVA